MEQKKQEGFQPREAAARVGADTTTLSRCTRSFPEFFSSTAREPTRTGRPTRRYTEHDVTVLRRIKELYAAGAITDHVREMLHREFVAQATEEIGLDAIAHLSGIQVVRDSNLPTVVRDWEHAIGEQVEALLATLHRAQLVDACNTNDHRRLLRDQYDLLGEQRQFVEHQQRLVEMHQELRKKDVLIQQLHDELRYAERHTAELTAELQTASNRVSLMQQEAENALRRLAEVPEWIWRFARWLH